MSIGSPDLLDDIDLGQAGEIDEEYEAQVAELKKEETTFQGRIDALTDDLAATTNGDHQEILRGIMVTLESQVRTVRTEMHELGVS